MLIKKGGVRSDPSAARATSAGRKGSIFSTMSARSLGDADEGTAAYAAATKVGVLCEEAMLPQQTAPGLLLTCKSRSGSTPKYRETSSCVRHASISDHKQTCAGGRQVPSEGQDSDNGHAAFLPAMPSYNRPGIYNSAVMDIFGKASIDPYAFVA